MNGHYHTAQSNLQTRGWNRAGTFGNDGRGGGVAEAAKPAAGLSAHRKAPVHRRLGGRRELLRALRAAEMAAWEAVPPSTLAAPVLRRQVSARQGVRAAQPNAGPDREAVLILVLAAAALVSLLLALHDASALLEGWSAFARGISQLLR